MERVEGDLRVVVARKYEEWIDVLLAGAGRTLERAGDYEYHRPHHLAFVTRPDLDGWRQELRIRVAGLVTVPWRRGSDVGRNALRNDLDPNGLGRISVATRELEAPQRGIDAQIAPFRFILSAEE